MDREGNGLEKELNWDKTMREAEKESQRETRILQRRGMITNKDFINLDSSEEDDEYERHLKKITELNYPQ